MSVTIVGAGLGGLRTAQGLRDAGYAEPIHLVGAESHLPYDRPPLTKRVLCGDIDDTTFDVPLNALQIDLRLNTKVTGVDAERHVAMLDDGSTLHYDDLVLAPGASPRMLPGIRPRRGMHVVRTIDDALGLRTALRSSGRLVVVGGGFVGCEVAATARRMGVDVDLVEALPAPLARVLGPAGAGLVATLLTQRGVRVHAGVGVTDILGDECVTGVHLADGTTLMTPDVVIALGVVPDISWLATSGFELDDGICCDASGRTSQPRAWALGDAANWMHPLAGGRRRIEHWTSTADQAGVVAANIAAGAGGTAVYDGVPYFWSDIFEVKLQALGFFRPDDDADVVEASGHRLVLYSRDGVVTGVLGFSAPRHVMKLRQHIAARSSVDVVVESLSK